MYTLSVDTSIRDAIDAVLSSGYSRIPAYKETTDTIAGFIYVKDLLRVCCEGNMDTTIESHLRPPYFVPESKMVDDLLTELQDKKIHLAIVVDEYGGVAGLVTLEDIMEEIVGEIQDETDKKEEELFESISKDEFVFRGRIEVEDVNELMKIDLSNDEVDTLGGYIYSKIGRVPKVGESVAADDILFTVMQVTGRRIRKVRAQRSLTKEKGNPADA
jgi:CBS domain containing-hemolysin-like protein